MLKKHYCNRREQTSFTGQAKYIQDFLSHFVWDDGIAVLTTKLDFRVGLGKPMYAGGARRNAYLSLFKASVMFIRF